MFNAIVSVYKLLSNLSTLIPFITEKRHLSMLIPNFQCHGLCLQNVKQLLSLMNAIFPR